MSDQYGNNVDGEIWVALPGTPAPKGKVDPDTWYKITGLVKLGVSDSE